ncbi:MAG: twin-arginine translocase TatA/TatE family subunit [Magnetococcales bacterium]|nr:twin-arginine translocase TatA/TatE family subunit [Magnetococcales bacterium]
MLSTWHIFIVLLIVLVVFGAGKLPKVMEDIGRGVKGFKRVMESDDEPATAKPQQIQPQAQPQPQPSHPQPAQTAATIEGEVKKETKT